MAAYVIKAQSELLKNQRHAEIMEADKAFDVLQTKSGRSIFFSIATDDVLYVTREVDSSHTGWTTKLDLSSKLSAEYNNQKVIAKSFALSQSLKTDKFNIALVITVEGSDYLWASMGHSNSEEGWMKGIEWTKLSFDANGENPYRRLNISDVYLMDIPEKDGSPIDAFFVDVVRDPDPSNKLQLLDRYYITTTKETPHWHKQKLSVDIQADTLSSCVGLLEDDYDVPGMYTFGRIGTSLQLEYAPQWDPFDKHKGPAPVTLYTAPDDSRVIASATDRNGYSILFVAADSGLHVLMPGKHKQKARPELVVTAPPVLGRNLFDRITEMTVSSLGSRTIVWCLNSQDKLFYVSCPRGKEDKSSAWSVPIPICSGVEGFSFYINNKGVNNVLFAHMSGQNLTRFTQNPSNSIWEPHKILLPPPEMKSLAKLDTFTTHIQTFDEKGSPAADKKITIKAFGQTSAYINDTYYALEPGVPVQVDTGSNGNVTVMQQTKSLSASCFEISMDGAKDTLLVDPLKNANAKLEGVKSGDQLRNTKIPKRDGGEKNLTTASSQEADAVAQTLPHLLEVRKKLPQDGTVQKTPVKDQNTPSNFGITYGSKGHQFFKGSEASVLENEAKVITGDLSNWLSDAWEHVTKFTVKTAEGFWHFVVEIAGEVWTAVLDCISAVATAIEFVFKKIKVFIEELIAWLGFLFVWKDIVRTKNVLKNIIYQHSQTIVPFLKVMEEKMKSYFKLAEGKISTWAELKDTGTATGKANEQYSSQQGMDSPQAHWGVYHFQNGIGSARMKPKTVTDQDLPDDVKKLIETLGKAVSEEEKTLKTAINQVIALRKELPSLTAVEIVKKVAGIVALVLTKTAEDAFTTLADIALIVLDAAIKLLDEEIEIPVITAVYEEYAGGKFSVLDLVCLVGAVPVTLIYKIVEDEVPFPDNDETRDLINADSFDAIIDLLKKKSLTATANKRHDGPSGSFSAFLDKVLGAINVLACFGGLINTGCNLYKWNQEGDFTPSNALNYATLGSYYAYVLPNISSLFSPGLWSEANMWITSGSVAKAFIDNATLAGKAPGWSKISGGLESWINFFWLFAAVGGFIETAINGAKASDDVSFASNVLFDVAGSITFLTDKELDPEVAPVAMGASVLMNGFASIGFGATGILLWNHKLAHPRRLERAV